VLAVNLGPKKCRRLPRGRSSTLTGTAAIDRTVAAEQRLHPSTGVGGLVREPSRHPSQQRRRHSQDFSTAFNRLLHNPANNRVKDRPDRPAPADLLARARPPGATGRARRASRVSRSRSLCRVGDGGSPAAAGSAGR
jgi:hypothetical protein